MEKFKELSIEEMQEVNGGLTWIALAGVVVVSLAVEALLNPGATIDAMKSGWDKAGELEKYANL
ncbi:class IIb bacteriocin, lactobin A/cerein 7B family [Algoriphagus sp.]|uniref:class IIb bacteriocin, lactobin A/cerein 7B family n=1 Tax=Algoriphagus sp. TaxID=1872435 RepID=UPI003919BDC3